MDLCSSFRRSYPLRTRLMYETQPKVKYYILHSSNIHKYPSDTHKLIILTNYDLLFTLKNKNKNKDITQRKSPHSSSHPHFSLTISALLGIVS